MYLHWVDIEDTSVPMMVGTIQKIAPKRVFAGTNSDIFGIGTALLSCKKKLKKEMFVKTEDVQQNWGLLIKIWTQN